MASVQGTALLALEEEIEVTNAVYGSQVSRISTNEIVLRINTAIVTLRFPPCYPLTCGPVVKIEGIPNAKQVAEAASALWSDVPGEPVIHRIFELIQQCIFDQEPETVIAPPKEHKQIIPVVVSEPLTDRKSKFVGRVATVHSRDEVDLVLEQLREDRKISAATHPLMYAFRLCDDEWSSDDGEKGAGEVLRQLLHVMELVDVVVVVTRWYGGVHLGPDRFRHIKTVAIDAIRGLAK